ncbi:MAG: hypothetical protein K940chlam3_01135 [Chlamydiae bacterium]|nr:hypothetical protein [Chlamydiota bacterium]
MIEINQNKIFTLPEHMRLALPKAQSARISRKISLKAKSLRDEVEFFDPFEECWIDGSMSDEPDVSSLTHYMDYIESLQTNGIPSYVQIAYVDNQVNYGVFAEKEMQKGEFIGFYTGKLGMGEYDTESMYLFELLDDHKIYVDACDSGNFTRYINHTSPENCNVDAILFLTKSEPFTIPVIILYASKTIQKGEQLLYDYGKEYWKAMGMKPASITPSTYIQLN